jgi:hypothetical protein
MIADTIEPAITQIWGRVLNHYPLIVTVKQWLIQRDHFLDFFLGALPGLPAFSAALAAVDSDMATACFIGLPAFFSVLIFDAIDLEP